MNESRNSDSLHLENDAFKIKNFPQDSWKAFKSSKQVNENYLFELDEDFWSLILYLKISSYLLLPVGSNSYLTT